MSASEFKVRYLASKTDEQQSLNVLREMRSACALDESLQRELLQDISFFKELSKCCLMDHQNPLVVRCTLQVLHNICVNNPFLKHDHVSHLCQILSHCSSSEDVKVLNFSAAILLLLVKNYPERLDLDNVCPNIMKGLVNGIAKEAEFSWFALKNIINNREDLLMHNYSSLKKEHKVICLDGIVSVYQESPLSPGICKLLRDEFKEQSKQILTTLKSVDNALCPEVMSRLLNLLCDLSADEKLCGMIQSDKSLLIDAVYLLRMMHDIGKTGEREIFVPVNKIADLSKDEVQRSPVFGFKRDVIRLIANMCWKNKGNQDQVREVDGISLLLDCSPIDGKNPLIMQWVIVAMRNICFENQNNQQYLAAMDKEGVVVSSLEEQFGLKLKL